MRQKRVFREWQHPRDSRGRFSRSGGASWAKRAATGFAKAEEGRVTPPPVAGRPRIGRNAKAALVLNQHVPGAGDALSRKWTPPEKLPPNSIRKPAGNFSLDGTARQVLHEGVWREVTGTGGGKDGDYVLVRGDDGERIKVFDDGKGLITRFSEGPEFHEPLRGKQVAQMAAWRADAARPPQLRVLTNREENIERYKKEVADAEEALKDARRKARARVRKKYPSSDGYDKRDWDRYVEDDDAVWRARTDLNSSRNYLEGVQRQGTESASATAYLDQPSLSPPVLVGELNRDRPLAVYGDLLNIQDDDQGTHRHLRDLSLLPAELHLLVAQMMAGQRNNPLRSDGEDRAAGIWVGTRPVSELNHSEDLVDDPAKLAPSTDGSYKDTRRWSEVAGVYRGHRASMIVGTAEYSKRAGEHGQHALHEFGHALDDAVGRRLSYDRASRDAGYAPGAWASSAPEWQALWRQMVDAAPDMNPYFSQQGEDKSRREMWAEAFGEWSRARARARQSDIYAGIAIEGHHGEFLANRGAMALVREFRIPKENRAAAVAMNAYFEALAAKLGVDL